MTRMTNKVNIHPACKALTGRMRIKPPIMPLIIPITVNGELNDIIIVVCL
jgi:hypothetical protein